MRAFLDRQLGRDSERRPEGEVSRACMPHFEPAVGIKAEIDQPTRAIDERLPARAQYRRGAVEPSGEISLPVGHGRYDDRQLGLNWSVGSVIVARRSKAFDDWGSTHRIGDGAPRFFRG